MENSIRNWSCSINRNKKRKEKKRKMTYVTILWEFISYTKTTTVRIGSVKLVLDQPNTPNPIIQTSRLELTADQTPSVSGPSTILDNNEVEIQPKIWLRMQTYLPELNHLPQVRFATVFPRTYSRHVTWNWICMLFECANLASNCHLHFSTQTSNTMQTTY